MQRNPTRHGGAGRPGLSRFARIGGAAALVVAILSGCATLTESPAETGSGVESPAVEPQPEPYSYDRAFDLLFEGQADRAERMLKAHLETSPGDDRARNVLRQIQAPPNEYLGESSFEYKVKPGESLSVLSQRFLGSYRLFYILARYNNIDTPSLVRAGQVLRIPNNFTGEAETGTRGTRETSLSRESFASGTPAAPQQEPTPEATLAKYSGVKVDTLGREQTAKLGAAYQQWIDEALAHGDAGEAGNRLAEAKRRAPTDGRWNGWLDGLKRRVTAEVAYQEGLELQKVEPAAAAQAFRRALDADPDHSGARTALDALRRDTVPQLHEKAVILYRNQKLDEAIDLWNQILAIDPGYEPAQGYRTRALELRRRLKELK